MIAALLQVHDNVQQGDLISSSFGIQSLKILCQNEFVVFSANKRIFYHPALYREMFLSSHLLLHGAKLHSDNKFSLGGHVFEDISLQPPEHVRAKHVMKFFYLVLLSNVSKLFQEDLQFAAGGMANIQ